ncbi:MAG: hypothetical protein FalmKO_08370 [Falsiruegeria mediterranea]
MLARGAFRTGLRETPKLAEEQGERTWSLESGICVRDTHSNAEFLGKHMANIFKAHGGNPRYCRR